MEHDARSNGRNLFAAAMVGAATAFAGTRLVARLTRGRFGDDEAYNVAKVSVSGPIARDKGRPSPLSRPGGPTADDVVEQIEAADEDEDVEALVVELNTPGGEVLPSDDIRRAAAAFDGPTVAYATDLCASGGYWIASGCDELWARDASLVGSIGVVGSRPNAAGLADKLGISYEQFTAGEYKDAGVPLREIEDDEREYLQGIIDGYYEQFVETVSEGRDMDPEAVRETEARVYLGTDALELGLVDELGTEDDVEDRLESLIGAEPEVREFTPERGLAERLGIGTERVAFAAGSGVASVFADDGGDVDVELR
ncbi:signal peptide peptidase SppA, 36K type [Halorubrum aidingense JCM 13560]|uniref:Signal peptide peptidase SppA, 36K type n=1 Tax=Halorubrum aidingense JCM 13560 TaxID=1230454 RepID=M0PM89_9EURY|nr:signal peptide peptidase SppA [Halorubrum aidingense]EMA69875.1 signal peptide peptidase SppA, 36K type [Halorubrum aidingense JCM 13560]